MEESQPAQRVLSRNLLRQAPLTGKRQSNREWACEESALWSTHHRNSGLNDKSGVYYPALLERTGDIGKRCVGVLAYKPDGADHKNENRCQHHGIFRDILSLILQPNPVQKNIHVPPHGDSYKEFFDPQRGG